MTPSILIRKAGFTSEVKRYLKERAGSVLATALLTINFDEEYNEASRETFISTSTTSVETQISLLRSLNLMAEENDVTSAIAVVYMTSTGIETLCLCNSI